MAARSRERSAAVADIGDIPAVMDVVRRESCRFDLLKFLTTYFPFSTGLSPFGDDHQRVIRRIQVAILEGGRYANAIYRGFAKTSISEGAAIWATCYGHRKFVPVFAADASLAAAIVASIKLELSENDLLCEDFPEVCHAVVSLENKTQRCRSQTCKGTLTHIEWTTDKIVFPTIVFGKARADIPTDEHGKTLASGAVIASYGMTGSIRGLKHKRADGTQQRPDFAIVDDPQSDESAGTALQVSKRMKIIRKTILRAAGHRTAMSCVVNGTVIRPNDLMHQLTDHGSNPDFQSERIPMVSRFADAHDSLWLGEYKRLRTSYEKDVVGDQARAHAAANQFYAEHRQQMDAGCCVSWESCFDAAKESSAIQHSYNILIDDGPDVFASECQQQPIEDVADPDAVVLTPAVIASKLNNYPKAVVPVSASHVVAMIDVQKSLLFWCAAAFSEDMTGYVIDYSCDPEQGRRYFSLADANPTLQQTYPGLGLEATLWQGLTALVDKLVSREWARSDGSTARTERILIDANWGESTDTIYEFCRQSRHSALLTPSHGMFIGASSRPMVEYTKKAGERHGPGWMIPLPGKRAIRHVTIDTNYWKTVAHNRLAAPFGEPGCVSLYGNDASRHQLFADHLTAEYYVPTTAKGRTINEWKVKSKSEDNHWLDCFVGCCVAASIQGCRVKESSKPIPTKLPKRSLSEMKAAARV